MESPGNMCCYWAGLCGTGSKGVAAAVAAAVAPSSNWDG